MKIPIKKPTPNIEHFTDVIRGKIVPNGPPFAELFLDEGVIKEIGEHFLGMEWVVPTDKRTRQLYWDFKIKVYHAMGYDYLWAFGAPVFPTTVRTTDANDRRWAETSEGPIQSFKDFYDYEWPHLTEEMLADYYYISDKLPEGMGMFVAQGDGFLEAAMNIIIGYESMCEMLYTEPELIKAVLDKAGEIIYDSCLKMIEVPKSAGVFIGDDMGFTTSTLFSPDFYRENTLPWHKKLAEKVHEKGQLYMLHSCGKLDAIMPDLINDVKIDAKHSYQAGAYDVRDYKEKYGKDIAIIGGVDVDKLCRMDETDLRAYVRDILNVCAPGGRYALGSGNSITDYVPLKNYFAMLDEGLKFSL